MLAGFTVESNDGFRISGGASMRKLTWMIILAATFLTLGACGDDDESGANNGVNNGADPDAGGLDAGDGGDGDAGNIDGGEDIEEIDIGPLTPESFEKKFILALNTATCETAFNDCPNSVRYPREGRRATSAEECIADVEALIANVPSELRALKAGEVFHEDVARECLENIIAKQRADVCYNASVAERASCQAAVTGTFAEGENCLSDSQCQSGVCARIPFDPENPEVCWGTCAPGPQIVGEGEPCEAENVECDATQNLLCDVAADSDARVCVALGTRAEGESCNYDSICTDGLVCDEGTCSTFALAQLGDDCTAPLSGTTASSNVPCEQGLVCANPDANGDGTCAEYGVDGDACTDTYTCKYGLYCNAVDGTCTPIKEEGEVCVESEECGFHLTCMWSEGDVDTCQPIRGFESCTLPG
jgi:hypothetical protein